MRSHIYLVVRILEPDPPIHCDSLSAKIETEQPMNMDGEPKQAFEWRELNIPLPSLHVHKPVNKTCADLFHVHLHGVLLELAFWNGCKAEH